MSDTPNVEEVAPQPTPAAPEPAVVDVDHVPAVAETLEEYVETITVDEDAGTAAT